MSGDAESTQLLKSSPPQQVAARSAWHRLAFLAGCAAISSLLSVGQLAFASQIASPPLALSIPMMMLAGLPAIVMLWAALATAKDRPPAGSSRRHRLLAITLDTTALTLGYALPQLINYSFLAETTAAGFIPFLLYLGLYPAAAMLLTRARTPGAEHASTSAARFATIWIGIEVLRGELMLGGFPWHLTAHNVPPELASWLGASIIGAYGMGWVLIYYLTRVLVYFRNRSLTQTTHLPLHRSPWRLLAALMPLGVLMGLFSSPPQTVMTYRLGLIQTNIPQSNKLAADLKQRVQDTVTWSQAAVDLAKQSASQGQPLDAILWPETVFNGLALDVDSLKAEQAAGLAFRWTPGTAGIEGINGQLPSTFFADTMLTQQAASGVPWLVGTIAYNNLSLTLSPEGRVKEAHNGKFNSVAMIDQGQVSPKRYDKVELMAFGEYIPIAWRWPSLQRSITVLGAGGMEFDLAQGSQDTSFRFNTADGKSISFVTPICFEACSHSACVSLLYDMDWLGAKSRRAHLMFNPTNDGWFYDHDLGRRLHLLAARWRCMELAAPMVRVANTGISCWIDMRGVVHDVIPARQFGTKVITVPSTDWTPPPSLYARLGHHVRWLMLSLLVLQVVFLFAQTRPKNPPASASLT